MVRKGSFRGNIRLTGGHMFPSKPHAPTGTIHQRLASRPEPIRIALIGAGAMGRGLLYQCGITPGFRCVVVTDIALEKAIECARSMQLPYRIVNTAGEMQDTIRRGELAICEDGALVATRSAGHYVAPSADSARAEAALNWR